MGIHPSKWESVFESFEQADPSTTRLHGGTGLGLCIVRTLVSQMGGEIKVVKKNGPGTVMQLLFASQCPCRQEHCSLKFSDHNLTSPFWTETLEHYTGYSEDQLRDYAKLFISYHAAVAESKLKAVYRKFSDADKGVVALCPPGKTV